MLSTVSSERGGMSAGVRGEEGCGPCAAAVGDSEDDAYAGAARQEMILLPRSISPPVIEKEAAGRVEGVADGTRERSDCEFAPTADALDDDDSAEEAESMSKAPIIMGVGDGGDTSARDNVSAMYRMASWN